MARTATVTVVVPARNAERSLGGTLESIQDQSLVPAHVVVVDEGSVDGTVGVANTLGVQLMSVEAGRVGQARNGAIAAAKSDYIAFCSAGDWFVPDKLERDIARIESLGASCLAGEAWIVRGDRVRGRSNRTRIVPDVITEEFLIQSNPVISSTVLASREALVRAGGFDESQESAGVENYDLWLRLAAQEPIAYSSSPMTFCRERMISLEESERAVRSIDAILQRVGARHSADEHYQRLIRSRRAAARLDHAWELMRAERYALAATWIRDAQQIMKSWKGFKMSLRAMLKR